MPPLHPNTGGLRRALRLLALAAATSSCTSDHIPTAPAPADQLTPSFATAPSLSANAGGPYTGVEGSPITFDGTASTGTGLQFDWDFGDNTTHGTGATPSHSYADNKVYTVRLVVTDTNGVKSTTAQTTATVSNAPPVITLVPPTPTPRAKISFTLAGTFTDPGVLDKHTGSFTWGDGKSSIATITEANGAGSASGAHNYAAAGTYSVRLVVVDNNGGADTATLALVVGPADLAPKAAVGGPYSGLEGSAVAFNGSASSDPEGDSLTYDWDFGDLTAHGTGAMPTHVYANNGAYTVKLVVTDNYGVKSTVSQTTATIANVAPVVTSFTGPVNPKPGVALTVSATFTDAGARDTHSAVFDWADTRSSTGTVKESGGRGTVTGSHTYAAKGYYKVRLRLSDNGGGVDTAMLLLSVGVPPRTPPTASAGGPYTGAEGQALTFDGTGSVATMGGALTFDWNFGDNSPHGTAAKPIHVYADNGTYTVTLVVADSFGTASQPAQTTATIANVAPVLGALTGPATPMVGNPATVSASFTDVGTADTHSASFDWGDGTVVAGTVTESGGAGSASGAHVYARTGTFTVTLTLSDKDGASATGQLVLVVGQMVGNNPPTANAGGPYGAVEGAAITFNGAGSSDPESDPLTYDWDYGDGTAHGTGVAPKHIYADNGVYTVTLIVTDSHGAASVPAQAASTITNAPPAVTVRRGPTTSFPVDHPVAVSATFSDPGMLDRHTASVDWGDGSTTAPARLYDSTVTAKNVAYGTTGAVHTYASPGTYTVTITITDKDGASTTSTQSLTAVPTGSAEVLLTVGDIALCTYTGDSKTSALLDQWAGWVQTLGDNAYPNGTDADFANCFDPADSWGRQKDRIHPAVGNHEYYATTDASGYFNYFGAAAGTRGQGYYSYNLGAWHIVVLNAELPVALNSAQNNWLRNDLATNTQQCTAIAVHEPLFSSDPTGGSPKVKPIWDAAYQYHVTLMLDGHAHDYERFAPQDPSGNADPVNGIREFVVGTGGDGNISSWGAILPNSEAQYLATYGIMKLTLDAGSYSWQYIPSAGTYTDSGTGTCR